MRLQAELVSLPSAWAAWEREGKVGNQLGTFLEEVAVGIGIVLVLEEASEGEASYQGVVGIQKEGEGRGDNQAVVRGIAQDKGVQRGGIVSAGEVGSCWKLEGIVMVLVARLVVVVALGM